jgi:hypothetical protein
VQHCASRDNMLHEEGRGPEVWGNRANRPPAAGLLWLHMREGKRDGCLHPRLVAISTHGVVPQGSRCLSLGLTMPRRKQPVSLAERARIPCLHACESPPAFP